jgi:hypothetical protein
VVNAYVVRRISLDDICAELHRLPDERQDLFEIPVDHIAARLLIWTENQRLDHQRHAPAITVRLDTQNIVDALVRDLRLAGNAEEIHHDAGGVEAERLLHRVADHPAEKRPRQLCAIDVGDIGAEDQRRLLPPWDLLQQFRLADRQLNRIGRSFHQGPDGAVEVLDPMQKATFIEEAMVHRHIEAAAGAVMEKAIEAKLFHTG